ncbi:MAG TPA: DUF4386 family protein [Candidatus Limnocylindria bacterium]
MDLARITGAVWLLYFVTAIPGGALLARSRDVGIALSVVSTIAYVAVTALLFALLEPVDRSTALVAAFVALTGCALTAVATVLQTAASTELADLGKRTVAISFAFFGCFMVLTGMLIARSTFLPQLFGGWFIVAGLAWATVLIPPVFRVLQVGIVPFGGLAEVALMLWLLARGIDVARWQVLLR